MWSLRLKNVIRHFRHVTRFFSPQKNCPVHCHKISTILVSITRPNWTKNITCNNIYHCPSLPCKGRASMPCLSFGSVSPNVSSWGIPNMCGSKSSPWGGVGRFVPENGNKACSFFPVFTSCELPLFPFFLCSFLFFASDVVDLMPSEYDMSPYI